MSCTINVPVEVFDQEKCKCCEEFELHDRGAIRVYGDNRVVATIYNFCCAHLGKCERLYKKPKEEG